MSLIASFRFCGVNFISSQGILLKAGHFHPHQFMIQALKELHDQKMASNSEKPCEKYTFFYGEKASPFSQFRAANFEVDGVKYKCAEMYMMHQKAVLFGDHEIAEQILLQVKPMAMKALGRKVRNFDEEVWKQNRRQIVKKGNIAKFSQNSDIRAELMATKGTTLVEASPRDRIWGIGMGKDNPQAKNKDKWRGQNLLGYILTEVRDELAAEEEEEDEDPRTSIKRSSDTPCPKKDEKDGKRKKDNGDK